MGRWRRPYGINLLILLQCWQDPLTEMRNVSSANGSLGRRLGICTAFSMIWINEVGGLDPQITGQRQIAAHYGRIGQWRKRGITLACQRGRQDDHRQKISCHLAATFVSFQGHAISHRATYFSLSFPSASLGITASNHTCWNAFQSILIVVFWKWLSVLLIRQRQWVMRMWQQPRNAAGCCDAITDTNKLQEILLAKWSPKFSLPYQSNE